MARPKVTATGLYKGKMVTVTCLKRRDGVHVYVDGKEDEYVKNVLDMYAEVRWMRYEDSYAYSPPSGTIEAYWIALHETLFDEPPEKVTTLGRVDTFGSPYSSEDTSGVVF